MMNDTIPRLEDLVAATWLDDMADNQHQLQSEAKQRKADIAALMMRLTRDLGEFVVDVLRGTPQIDLVTGRPFLQVTYHEVEMTVDYAQSIRDTIVLRVMAERARQVWRQRGSPHDGCPGMQIVLHSNQKITQHTFLCAIEIIYRQELREDVP